MPGEIEDAGRLRFLANGGAVFDELLHEKAALAGGVDDNVRLEVRGNAVVVS